LPTSLFLLCTAGTSSHKLSMLATETSAPTLPTALVYPIIQDITKAYKTPVTFLMINAVLGAMLIPLLLALFTFSKGASRKSPMFVSVVFVVLLGILLAVWYAYIMVWLLFFSLGPTRS
jgi:bacteriorhodopsin